MVKKRLVFFVTDRSFLLPTVSAALQVTEQSLVRRIADCAVFTVGMTDVEVFRLNECFQSKSIDFLRLPEEAFRPPPGVNFNKTHVPPVSLGRLVTNESIGSTYEHLVYLDGDIWIAGDIFPLVSHDVKTGHILAGNDQMFLREAYFGGERRLWKGLELYAMGLGTSPSQYFNAGVLAMTRQTWSEIAPRALQYFFSYSRRCLFHDQSALNAVCHSTRETLSPRFNFVTRFMQLLSKEDLEPSILHFTGGGKPWLDERSEWHRQFLNRFDYISDKLKKSSIPPAPLSSSFRQPIKTRGIASIANQYIQRGLERKRLMRFIREKKFELT